MKKLYPPRILCVEMGQKVLDYKAGKLTVEDIFLNGEGDVA